MPGKSIREAVTITMPTTTRPGATTFFVSMYPFFVLLLAPEIVNCALWVVRFTTESINRGGAGRAMESHVGLGLIYSLMLYGALFVIGVLTLVFIVWRLVKGVKLARGLRGGSEKSRRAAVTTNLVHVVFLVIAMFVCNYCNLPGRSERTVPCVEGSERRAVLVLDGIVLLYFAASTIYFTRSRVAGRFENP